MLSFDSDSNDDFIETPKVVRARKSNISLRDGGDTIPRYEIRTPSKSVRKFEPSSDVKLTRLISDDNTLIRPNLSPKLKATHQSNDLTNTSVNSVSMKINMPSKYQFKNAIPSPGFLEMQRQHAMVPPVTRNDLDIEFDSSENENDASGIAGSGSSGSRISPSPRLINYSIPSNMASGNSLAQSSLPDGLIPPQLHDLQPIPRSSNESVNGNASSFVPDINGHNIASSLDVESITTTGIDRGSLEVGVEPDLAHAEFLATSFKNRERMYNQNDSQSEISSEGNQELLNEFNPFLNDDRKSSEMQSRVICENATPSGVEVNHYLDPNAPTDQLNSKVSSSTPKSSVRPGLKQKNSDLTPIRKHYSRLSDKYARQLMKRREIIPKPLKGSSSFEPNTHQNTSQSFQKYSIIGLENAVELNQQFQIWPNFKWSKLNQLVRCNKFTVEELCNSQILLQIMETTKEDLTDRITFLTAFNKMKNHNGSVEISNSRIGRISKT